MTSPPTDAIEICIGCTPENNMRHRAEEQLSSLLANRATLVSLLRKWMECGGGHPQLEYDTKRTLGDIVEHYTASDLATILPTVAISQTYAVGSPEFERGVEFAFLYQYLSTSSDDYVFPIHRDNAKRSEKLAKQFGWDTKGIYDHWDGVNVVNNVQFIKRNPS